MNKETGLISLPDLQRIVNEAKQQGWNLQFVYPPYHLPTEYMDIIDSIQHKDITPITSSFAGDAVVINGWEEIAICQRSAPIYVLRTSLSDFYLNVKQINNILNLTGRLEIVFYDEESFSEKDKILYRDSLTKLVKIVIKCWY